VSLVREFRNWLSKFPKEPEEHLALARAAIDAFAACQRKRRPAEADLEPLVTSASSPHKLVFETGCKLLGELAKTRQEARECFLRMARSKNATARFHSVAYLNRNLPEALRAEIVGLALQDRSAKKRRMAVERAESFKFLSLLPRLQAMQRTESDASVLQTLAFCIPLLRDGYLLEPSADGSGYYLTVSRPRATGGPFIPKEKCTPAFVRREVKRLLAEDS
jgi:hypothetical protein